ncbi:uncharacterized protein LOC123311962 [Coccinella septempunctata]|uniref:uncharacterized protein LOC123311962 n=1 Tax=Coccinella septempunctata TaxID=41139 RepID=UPI001D07F9E5|nr:uncharacterized protein LOC123311962 [Coccinella septempunctata]
MEKSDDNEVFEDQDRGNDSAKDFIHDLDDNVVQVSSSKKRGRKKKSESTMKSTPQKSPDQNEMVTKRGRKRKSVNYFALANPDLDEMIDEKDENKSLIKENSQRKSVRTTRRKSSMSNRDIEKENVDVEVEAGGVHSQSNQGEDAVDTTKDAGANTSKNSDSEEHSIDTLDKDQEYETHVKKKKVYRRTGTTTNLMNTLFSQADFKINTPVTKEVSPSVIRRGRPSKSKKKKTEKNSETEDNIFVSQTTVTCAVCNKDLEKNSWKHHKQRFHNNLAWRVGEPALDLNNVEFVKYTLNALYLAKVPFHCDICDKAVKSVQGFLSHKSVCGRESEDVKVACEKCGRKMLPVSMQSHMRFYHENKDRVEEVPKRQSSTIVSGSRRQAAEKALKVIKVFNLETSEINSTFAKYFEDLPFISSKTATEMLQNQIETLNRVQCKYPDCNFECFTAKDIKNHLKFCVKRPDNGYVCKHCLLVQLNIADIIYHIESTHNVIIEDEKKPEEKPHFIPNVRKRPTKQNSKKVIVGEKDKLQKKVPKFLLPLDKNLNVIFRKAYEWTLKFCEMNYSKVLPEEHFPCLKSDWDYMDLEHAEEYLPQMPYSCDVGFETVSGFQDILQKDHAFRKFELFESYLENNGNSTIFCGGPVTALSWMPTPHEYGSLHQVVAVATKPHPDAEYETDMNYNEKCFIQFWDVGPLRNTHTSLFRPKQAFCLQFDHGPVWDLQWCPSNCFDLSEQADDSEKLRRLGVLAVAGSDSYVYIYSIPNFKESGQFYNARPVLILIRNVFEKEKLGNMDYYATRISWTKASGHRYLAVGYSNGEVAMYDLWSESGLLRYKTDDNIDVLTPYTVLEAHSHSVTAIALHHSHDGCKWLMTGSLDRTVRTWDLKEKRCVRTLKANIVNDAVWMTHWMCHIIGYDEASTIGNACSAIQQCKDGFSDTLYLFHCSSAITSLSTSDWLNGIIQGNSVGEIFATFPKQLMINLNWKNSKHSKLLFGYTTLVEKDKSIEERLKVNSEKQKALRNQLKVKTKITTKELPSDREVMHLDYNPHYFEYEPLVYHEMDDKYGLIFCDHKMKKWSDFPKSLQDQLSYSSERYSPSRPNMYPLQSITKIQFNMNRQASTYYVSGYQAGFIRLTYMKFLEDDPYVYNDSVNIKK